MKITQIILLMTASLYIANANAVIDDDAQIVKLRLSCLENNQEITNCFTTSNALMDWISNTRTTNAGNLLVNVGPGSFGFFRCSNFNNLSVKGAGPTNTFISGLHASNCFDLNVQDVTITNTFPSPVYWSGDGSSTWTNVHLDGSIYGWTETNCASTTSRPVHRWFSSKINSSGKVIYLADCSENWFYGSELVLTGAPWSGFKNGFMVRASNGNETTSFPEIHIYGSVVRVILDAGVSFNAMRAFEVGTNGEVHIHGSGIDVIGNNLDNTVTAMYAHNGGKIHASASSFVMKTGSQGVKQRLSNNNSTIMAPYTWEPQILNTTNFVSIDGQDMATEVICNGSNCSPHNMVYMSSCTTNGPWYDSFTKQCRN